MSAAMINLHDDQGLDLLRARCRLDPHLLRRLRTEIYKKFSPPEQALHCLPVAARRAFHEEVCFASLRLHERRDSRIDGATKLALRTSADHLIETVILRPETGRSTVCVSCQVGCAANCRFCATASMGWVSNLNHREIVDQVLIAGRMLRNEGRSVRNVVFMGMGEPLHNEEALYRALADLVAPHRFHLPPRRILVSTVGMPAAMLRLARRFPEVNLALSLHSVRQPVRESLVPLARKVPLPELRRTLEALNTIQDHSVMIEYLLLNGVNDSLADATELVDFLGDLDVHVNLIPYNPIEGAPQLSGTERPDRDAFARVLKQAGLKTTVRYSLGADIAAACGQLVSKQSTDR